jgi:hypothetical protein
LWLLKKKFRKKKLVLKTADKKTRDSTDAEIFGLSGSEPEKFFKLFKL